MEIYFEDGVWVVKIGATRIIYEELPSYEEIMKTLKVYQEEWEKALKKEVK